MKVGVLALQGAFREHIMTFEALGVSSVAVRLPEQLSDLSGLVIPGGESTAIGKLMRTYEFYDAIRQQHGAGMAVWGTCAGAILMASVVLDAVDDQEPLGLMDIDVRRNAYGRQLDSFEAELDVHGLEGETFRGVFIRAPWIERIGAEVDVLAEHDGHIVAAQHGDLLATTFHPELTGDPRMHRFFLDKVVGS
ncbi:MAG: pyridoxal 5'-phosphate synthase glutaminase subunit PdxT [Actinomycetota bacterium]|nr:pyridoxal 5'-phosphate synthase glutaminase subunit PdxT [Actinomycetota bacterium]MDP3631433.1 pyridoxal 5'-phosphate synthase glutaminase subunit PdxT [Actinomycetota bacterium]